MSTRGGGPRVRAVGWLALVVLGFSVASFLATRSVELQGEAFYRLDLPFGPIPGVLWVALVVALWLSCRRTPGEALVLSAAAFWSVGYVLAMMADSGLWAAVASLCWAVAPLLLGFALLRSGYPFAVWALCLLWGGVMTLSLVVSYALIPLHIQALASVVEFAYMLLAVVVPALRSLFLGVLGVSHLMKRRPEVRLTSASSGTPGATLTGERSASADAQMR